MSDDIRMIRDSAGAVSPRKGDLRRIRALRFQLPGFDPKVWQQMCDLGWPGLVTEAGLGMAAFCALAEELGAALVPEPLVGAAFAARLLRGATRDAHLSGTQLILPAWQDPPGTLSHLAHQKITGRKLFIPQAAGADGFVVTTEHQAVLVMNNAPGLHLDHAPTQDGGNFGTLTLQDTPATLMEGVGPVEIATALEEATLATAATLLGVMERAFAITLDYLRTRRQFGRLIGSFQALQHRAADLQVQIALTRASVESAATAIDAGLMGAPLRAAVSRAKARASDAALLVTRQAIQLHGGIGYTDEHDIGLFLRRAMVLANLHGSAASHRRRFAKDAPEDDSEP